MTDREVPPPPKSTYLRYWETGEIEKRKTFCARIFGFAGEILVSMDKKAGKVQSCECWLLRYYNGLTKDRSYWPEGGLMLISLGKFKR